VASKEADSLRVSVAGDWRSFRPRWYAIVPAMFAAVAIAVPWLLAHTPEVGLTLQRGFALVCHQQPERSFYLFGGTVAVCARCLGIYLGAAVGLLLRVPRNVAWRWLIAAVAINLVDWLAEIAGLHGNWMVARLMMGIALGVAGALLVAASFAEYSTPTQAKQGRLAHSSGC
jgi:uncharacterized membrane protein